MTYVTKKRNLIVFDTTLRDGEQVPGARLNTVEKVEIAKQLEKLGVDVIEAGFPISSPGDFESVSQIAKTIKNCIVCGLARATEKDIDAAYEAIKGGIAPRIHTFIATSPIHMKYKLKKKPDEVVKMAVAAVKRAKKYVSDVEFSCEDAGRSDKDFLVRIVNEAIMGGATTINIPDTTGYMYPEEYKAMIEYLFAKVKGVEKVIVSTHNHNDLGLATATTLAGVIAGARQVEVTINGVGERAGNAALEEVIMALRTRNKSDVKIGINTQEIIRTSRIVSSLMGLPIQANKAIVGRNAFAHSSGIHQDGILKLRETYEIINPEDVGLKESDIILTARSGRKALLSRLEKIGYKLEATKIDDFYNRFIQIADKKKEVTDRDLQQLIAGGESSSIKAKYNLELIQVICGNKNIPTSTIQIKDTESGEVVEETATGTGPVDASFKAIDKVVTKKLKLKEFLVQAVTEGIDAQGKVNVEVEYKGQNYYGQGADTDIVVASAKAYLDAINSIAT